MKTKEDIAYNKLKRAILAGELPHNEFLSQRMLAEKADSIVITIRAALRRLEKDGLVEGVPKWGFRIPQDTEESVRDRYFMRELLETAAVKRIAGHHSEVDAARLRELAKKCDEISGKRDEDVEAFAMAHMELHSAIGEMSQSKLLIDTLTSLNMRSLMLQNAYRGWARGGGRSARHHQELAEAILSGHEEKAEQAILEHVRQGLNYELEIIHEQEAHDKM